MSCWRMDQSPSCLPQEQFAPLNFQDDNQPEVHYNPWLDLVTGDAYTANPHRISVLSSCSPPEKVGAIKSFIGAYRFLARVNPTCSSLFSPLDDVISERSSTEVITWTDKLYETFAFAKKALTTSRSITLPKPDDQLWIVTNRAVRKPGIAATYYVTRHGNLHLAGYFPAQNCEATNPLGSHVTSRHWPSPRP